MAYINKYPKLRRWFLAFSRITQPIRRRNPFRILMGYGWFFRDLWNYSWMSRSKKTRLTNLYPCLLDKTETTSVDPYYLYQDTWLAKKIFEAEPKYHVDIGSFVLAVGILAQFTSVCSVDIRPLPIVIENLGM